MRRMVCRLRRFLTKRRRGYIYAVSLAAGPVLIHYDVIEPEALPIFAPFLLALLNLSDDEV